MVLYEKTRCFYLSFLINQILPNIIRKCIIHRIEGTRNTNLLQVGFEFEEVLKLIWVRAGFEIDSDLVRLLTRFQKSTAPTSQRIPGIKCHVLSNVIRSLLTSYTSFYKFNKHRIVDITLIVGSKLNFNIYTHRQIKRTYSVCRFHLFGRNQVGFQV